MSKTETPDIVGGNVAGEEWRPVQEWDAYEVSNLGRVRSVDRFVRSGRSGIRFEPGKLLSPRNNYLGYHIVTLRSGRLKKLTPFVHRLVAKSFIKNPNAKPYVNHIDCDPSNNRAENLEWCTQAENLAHMDTLGRRVNGMTGKRPAVALLTDDDVRELRNRWNSSKITFEQLGVEFGISKRSAMRCAKRESYCDVH